MMSFDPVTTSGIVRGRGNYSAAEVLLGRNDTKYLHNLRGGGARQYRGYPGSTCWLVAARPRAMTGRRRGGRHAVAPASLADLSHLNCQLLLELA